MPSELSHLVDIINRENFDTCDYSAATATAKTKHEIVNHQIFQGELHGGCFELVESKKESNDNGLHTVFLDDLPADGIILKPDDIVLRFAKGGGWNKRCDYLVLFEREGEKYAIFIELKSKVAIDSKVIQLCAVNKENRKIAMQFVSTDAIFDLFSGILHRQYGENLSEYRRIFVLLFLDVKSAYSSTGKIPDTTGGDSKYSFLRKYYINAIRLGENGKTVSLNRLMGMPEYIKQRKLAIKAGGSVI